MPPWQPLTLLKLFICSPLLGDYELLKVKDCIIFDPVPPAASTVLASKNTQQMSIQLKFLKVQIPNYHLP